MNQKSFLAASFATFLALTGVACDDDPTTPPRDAAMERAPDTTGGTDTGADRTPDTSPGTDGGVDRTPDTSPGTDGSVDRVDAADGGTDSPVDTATDVAVDRTPDTADVAADLPADLAADLLADLSTDVIGAVVNNCVTYVDRVMDGAQGTDRRITFEQSLATDPERCMKVRRGASVCFETSSFATHPLVPSGGDSPTPIQATSTGTLACFPFNTIGTFGYKCNVHPAMAGAIQVVAP